MAEESDSLKEEMSAALRGDLERARRKRVAEAPPAPAPEHEPVREDQPSLLRRLFR